MVGLVCCGVDVYGCKFSFPTSLSRCEANANITSALKRVSSCDAVEKAVSSFARAVNENSATLCEDLLDIISLAVPTVDRNHLKVASTVIDFCGVGVWIYLASRNLLKHLCPFLKKESVLQSPFQVFLSGEELAFGMTFTSLASFANFWVDSPECALVISVLAAGVPAFFGGIQIGYDVFKMIRGLFRCCGKCLPSVKKKKEEEILLRVYHEKKAKKHKQWLEENPLDNEEDIEEEENAYV